MNCDVSLVEICLHTFQDILLIMCWDTLMDEQYKNIVSSHIVLEA